MPKQTKTQKIVKIKELDVNPVRDFLKTNPNLLSLRNISKKLNMKRRKVLYYCNNSNFIRPINYGEIGCYSHNVQIFCHI